MNLLSCLVEGFAAVAARVGVGATPSQYVRSSFEEVTFEDGTTGYAMDVMRVARGRQKAGGETRYDFVGSFMRVYVVDGEVEWHAIPLSDECIIHETAEGVIAEFAKRVSEGSFFFSDEEVLEIVEDSTAYDGLRDVLENTSHVLSQLPVVGEPEPLPA